MLIKKFTYDLRGIFLQNQKWLMITLMITFLVSLDDYGNKGTAAILEFFRGITELGYSDSRSLSDLPFCLILTVYLVLYSAVLYLAKESNDSKTNVLLHFSSKKVWIESKLFCLTIYALGDLAMIYLGLFSFSFLFPKRISQGNLAQAIPQPEIIKYLFITVPVCLCFLLAIGILAYYLINFASSLMIMFLIIIMSFFKFSELNPFTFFMLQRSTFVSVSGVNFTKSWVFIVPFCVIYAGLIIFADKLEILKEKKRD